MIHDAILFVYDKIRCSTIKDVVRESFSLDELTVKQEQDCVLLEVSAGGGLVYGGRNTMPKGVNKFIVPQKQLQLEEPYSVFYFHSYEKHLSFFRIFVEHINTKSGEIVLNVVFADAN